MDFSPDVERRVNTVACVGGKSLLIMGMPDCNPVYELSSLAVVNADVATVALGCPGSVACVAFHFVNMVFGMCHRCLGGAAELVFLGKEF